MSINDKPDRTPRRMKPVWRRVVTTVVTLMAAFVVTAVVAQPASALSYYWTYYPHCNGVNTCHSLDYRDTASGLAHLAVFVQNDGTAYNITVEDLICGDSIS